MAMTALERQKIAQGNAFQYQAYKDDLQEYFDKAMRQTRKVSETGIVSAYKPDPTARAGVMLACLPDRVEEKRKWIMAIDNAWDECRRLDGANKTGLSYLLEENFHLTGTVLPREKNGENRREIMRACGISETTFYDRLARVIEILVYHATTAGLL